MGKNNQPWPRGATHRLKVRLPSLCLHWKWCLCSSFNDVDSFREHIAHSGGDLGAYKGVAWYRKHFSFPADLAGHMLFLEFEAMRQAGDILLNGMEIGLYENGITAYGLDLTDAMHLDGEENVLAIRLNNQTNHKERSTGTRFEWNANDFNPDFGGINRRVWLYATGKIYQTLPLYEGLNSTGVYI